MKIFYVAEFAEGRWSFIGNVPDPLRNGYGKPETFSSKEDALSSAFHNGYPFVEEAALVSKYAAQEWA
jgi:hypothetical protein